MPRFLFVLLLAIPSLLVGEEVFFAQEVKADPLPARALGRFGTSKLRHGSRILSLAYSPDSRFLAAGGGDDPVRLWDTETGAMVRTLPEAWVHGMVFTKRGAGLLTAGPFKTIRMWEVASGKEMKKYDGHKAAIKALALNLDGDLLASGDADGNIILWELLVGPIVTFKGHTDEITCLAFDPKSKLLASGSADRTIRLWDLKTNKFLKQMDGGCMVTSLAFLDGKSLASGGDDHQVRIWDVEAGKQSDAWKGHEGTVESLSVVRDEDTLAPRFLVSGAHDGTIRLWDLPRKGDPKIIRRSLGDSDALAVSPSGDKVAAAGINNTIRVFQTDGLKEVTFGPGHQAGVHALALPAGGKSLISAGTSGDFMVWDVASGKVISSWQAPKGGEVVIAIAPDGATLASTVGTDDIHLWDPATGKEKFSLPGGGSDPVLSLAFSHDGQDLIAGYRGGKVTFWNLKTKKAGQEVKYSGPAYTLALSKDGKTLAVSGGNKVTLWSMDGLRELKTFGTRTEGPESTWPVVATMAFDPDGRFLALSCYDGIIRIMDAATGKEDRACEGHTSVAYGMAFSPDGRTLATASFDRTIRIWEAFSGQPIAALKGHQGPGTAIAFAQDGRSFFSGSADTTIVRWDAVGTGTVLEVKLAVPEMDTMWLNLAGEDTARAHSVLWRFVGGGKDTASFIDGHLYLVNPKHIDKLFADLKSGTYKVRELASNELEKYGRWMEDRLTEASKLENTLEVQRRLDQLLAKLASSGALSMNQERLRVRRAMMILEQIGDESSLRVLEKLANGAPTPALQHEAQGSVDRIKARMGK